MKYIRHGKRMGEKEHQGCHPNEDTKHYRYLQGPWTPSSWGHFFPPTQRYPLPLNLAFIISMHVFTLTACVCVHKQHVVSLHVKAYVNGPQFRHDEPAILYRNGAQHSFTTHLGVHYRCHPQYADSWSL